MEPLEILAVYTTVATEDEAHRIAHKAVQRKLAACVQMEPIRSVYEWQGKIHSDPEYRLLFKTTRAAFEPLRDLICSLHSYQLPAIFAVPVVAGLCRRLARLPALGGRRCGPATTPLKIVSSQNKNSLKDDLQAVRGCLNSGCSRLAHLQSGKLLQCLLSGSDVALAVLEQCLCSLQQGDINSCCCCCCGCNWCSCGCWSAWSTTCDRT